MFLKDTVVEILRLAFYEFARGSGICKGGRDALANKALDGLPAFRDVFADADSMNSERNIPDRNNR